MHQVITLEETILVIDDAEMLTSEMYDPYTWTTGAWK